MTSAKDHDIKPGAAHGTESRPGAAKSLEVFLALVPQGQDTDRARGLVAEIRRSVGTPRQQTGPDTGRRSRSWHGADNPVA